MNIFSSRDEEVVYKTLLQNEGLSVVSLAKKTKLHRPKLYVILLQLLNQKLIETSSKGKRVVYMTSSREMLEQKINDVKLALENEANDLLQFADGLQTVTNINSKEDIISLWDDVTTTLKNQGDYYHFTTATSAVDLGKQSREIFRKNRDSKGLWSHVLTDKPIDEKKGVGFNFEIKHVPAKNLPQDCLWLMYGDKYAFVDYAAESGYIVKNKRLAKFQQDIFRFFYNQA